MAEQLNLVVEPVSPDGCERCHSTGSCITDQLDDEGVWFRTAKCENCNGTGMLLCSAPECGRVATRAVHCAGCWRACCSRRACTVSVFIDVLYKVQPA